MSLSTVHKTLGLAIVLALASTVAHAEDVLLRLEPSLAAAVIARADSQDSIVRDAQMVAALPGWLESRYALDARGFVSTGDSSKNFKFREGAPIRAQARKSALVLTNYSKGDRFDVIGSDSSWIELRIRKTIPVFLQAPSGKSASSLTAFVPPIPRDDPPAVAAARKFDPSAGVASVDPGELPPETVTWAAAPKQAKAKKKTEPSPLVVPAEQNWNPPAESTLDIVPGNPVRNLTGVLVREMDEEGSNYPLRLVSNGKRLAYVDLSGVFLSDLRPLLDKRVFVSGEVQPLTTGAQELVIRAQDIQLAE